VRPTRGRSSASSSTSSLNTWAASAHGLPPTAEQPNPDHPFQDGQSFSYGDEWDDEELIYASRAPLSLQGPCVDYWESTGFDKHGEERRVYRFRLRPLGSRAARRRLKAATEVSRHSERDRASFRPRPFDPDRTPSNAGARRPLTPKAKKSSPKSRSGHQDTLRVFGLWLKDNGWLELEEIDGAIDLLASSGSRRVLFEIKSIRSGSERTRVRSGLANYSNTASSSASAPTRSALSLISRSPSGDCACSTRSRSATPISRRSGQGLGTRASRALFPSAYVPTLDNSQYVTPGVDPQLHSCVDV